MPTVSLMYSRKRAIGSLLIRAGAWFGPWSHTSIITPEGTVIEAVGSGVREVPLRDAMARASAFEVVQVECPRPAAAIAFARAQIGKPYDFGAILGFIVRRDWQDRECWECTELAEAALVEGGRQRWREKVYRIHPTMSYQAR